MEGQLVGRELELARVESFLDDAARGPRALLLEGDGGIGKTVLWREGVAGARRRGYAVLVARPTESERSLPYAALGDLLAAVDASSLARIPEPQREALEVALLRRESAAQPLARRAVALGVLNVLRELAAESVILIAVDDEHWLDRASAHALEFALRRLESERVVVLSARRAAGRLDIAAVFATLDRVRVGPLSLDSIARLLHQRVQLLLPPPVVAEVHRVTGGNPFFALEAGRALTSGEIRVQPGEPLALPDSLHSIVRRRIARLSREGRDAALAVSALSTPSPEVVRRAVADTAGIDEAVEAGVVAVESDRLRFTHPLLAAAVYTGASAHRRREVHARLARIVGGSERARHLALAADGPDATVAAALDEAAQLACTRGAPAEAASFCEQAARLTPRGNDVDVRRRLIAAADHHFQAGDTRRARVLLTRVIAEAPHGRERAVALMRLGTLTQYDGNALDASRLLEEALAEPAVDPGLRVEIHQSAAAASWVAGYLERFVDHAARAVEAAEQVGEPGLLATALAAAGAAEFLCGNGISPAIVERALALEEAATDVPVDFLPSAVFGAQLAYSGDLDRARALLGAAQRRALVRGETGALAVVLSSLADLELRAGRWARALRYADESCELAAQTRQEASLAFSLSSKALIEAHRGDVDAARTSVERGIWLAERVGAG